MYIKIVNLIKYLILIPTNARLKLFPDKYQIHNVLLIDHIGIKIHYLVLDVLFNFHSIMLLVENVRSVPTDLHTIVLETYVLSNALLANNLILLLWNVKIILGHRLPQIHRHQCAHLIDHTGTLILNHVPNAKILMLYFGMIRLRNVRSVQLGKFGILLLIHARMIIHSLYAHRELHMILIAKAVKELEVL